MDEKNKPQLKPHSSEELQKVLEKMAELAKLPKAERDAAVERLVPQTMTESSTATKPSTPRRVKFVDVQKNRTISIAFSKRSAELIKQHQSSKLPPENTSED